MLVRKEVKGFAEQMEKVLQANDYKGGWRNCTIEDLYARLLDEISELQSEINYREQDVNAIAQECIDIANFAMMIADVASRHKEKDDNVV